jgi:hypothetical protein
VRRSQRRILADLARHALAASALVSSFFVARAASAAEPIVQLAGYGGFQFGGSVEAHYAGISRSASIEDSPSFGGTIDFRVGPGAYAELAYSRQDTVLSLRGIEGTARYDLSVQYFTVGGLQQFRLPGTDIVRPTLGASLGAVRFGASTAEQEVDDWHVSLILEGGLVLQIIRNFGLRFRGRLLTTFLASQSTLFCGTQAGCAYTFSGTALFQGDMSAGAFIAF